MAAYRTQQEKCILDCLKNRTGQKTTAGQLFAELEGNKAPISRATVYRRLEKLVQSGIVKKYRVEGSSSACYEYTEMWADENRDMLHLICENCGCITHIECSHAAYLGEHIGKDHGFHVNPRNVVLHGVCSGCAPK